MNFNELFPSKSLKPDNLYNAAGEPIILILTVAGIEYKAMKNRDGKEEMKGILQFHELVDGQEKELILNRSNAELLVKVLGLADFNDLIGLQIPFCASTYNSPEGPKATVGIAERRLRALYAQGRPVAPQAPPPQTQTFQMPQRRSAPARPQPTPPVYSDQRPARPQAPTADPFPPYGAVEPPVDEADIYDRNV